MNNFRIFTFLILAAAFNKTYCPIPSNLASRSGLPNLDLANIGSPAASPAPASRLQQLPVNTITNPQSLNSAFTLAKRPGVPAERPAVSPRVRFSADPTEEKPAGTARTGLIIADVTSMRAVAQEPSACPQDHSIKHRIRELKLKYIEILKKLSEVNPAYDPDEYYRGTLYSVAQEVLNTLDFLLTADPISSYKADSEICLEYLPWSNISLDLSKGQISYKDYSDRPGVIRNIKFNVFCELVLIQGSWMLKTFPSIKAS